VKEKVTPSFVTVPPAFARELKFFGETFLGGCIPDGEGENVLVAFKEYEGEHFAVSITFLYLMSVENNGKLKNLVGGPFRLPRNDEERNRLIYSYANGADL